MRIDPDILAALLSTAAPDESVTLEATATAAQWRRLFEARQGGPEVLSTRQASKAFGWLHADWARWAREGKIPGAVREAKNWRLPRDACKRLADERMGRTEEPEPTTAMPEKRGGNYGKFRSRKQGPRLEP
jgi:hypothetical protein